MGVGIKTSISPFVASTSLSWFLIKILSDIGRSLGWVLPGWRKLGWRWLIFLTPLWEAAFPLRKRSEMRDHFMGVWFVWLRRYQAQKALCLVSCSADTILKVLMCLSKKDLIFSLTTGPCKLCSQPVLRIWQNRPLLELVLVWSGQEVDGEAGGEILEIYICTHPYIWHVPCFHLNQLYMCYTCIVS